MNSRVRGNLLTPGSASRCTGPVLSTVKGSSARCTRLLCLINGHAIVCSAPHSLGGTCVVNSIWFYWTLGWKALVDLDNASPLLWRLKRWKSDPGWMEGDRVRGPVHVWWKLCLASNELIIWATWHSSLSHLYTATVQHRYKESGETCHLFDHEHGVGICLSLV